MSFHIARLTQLDFGLFFFDFLRFLLSGFELFAPARGRVSLVIARGVEELGPARGKVSLVLARGVEELGPARGGVRIFRAPKESNEFNLIMMYGS